MASVWINDTLVASSTPAPTPSGDSNLISLFGIDTDLRILIVFGGIVGCLCILIIFVLIRMRRQRKAFERDDRASQSIQNHNPVPSTTAIQSEMEMGVMPPPNHSNSNRNNYNKNNNKYNNNGNNQQDNIQVSSNRLLPDADAAPYNLDSELDVSRDNVNNGYHTDNADEDGENEDNSNGENDGKKNDNNTEIHGEMQAHDQNMNNMNNLNNINDVMNMSMGMNAGGMGLGMGMGMGMNMNMNMMNMHDSPAAAPVVDYGMGGLPPPINGGDLGIANVGGSLYDENGNPIPEVKPEYEVDNEFDERHDNAEGGAGQTGAGGLPAAPNVNGNSAMNYGNANDGNDANDEDDDDDVLHGMVCVV